ncbi:MAG: siroheme synthase, partial [Erythrobacter sp.]|nr:siroheme synthase [Erythrobacter sp.]
MNGLPLLHRLEGARIVLVGSGAMADAKRRLVERAGGTCVSEAEAHQARLGFVALEDEREAEAAALRLKRLGLLVNVADRPDLCDFTLPSVLERGPITVAVATGGASAGLAKQLRLALERMLPATLGDLATRLGEAKQAMRERWPDGGERRRALDGALASGGVLDPLAAGSAERVGDWLGGNGSGATTGTVEIVLTGTDPDDLTLRQARLLGTADRVVHASAIPERILIRARADAERIGL